MSAITQGNWIMTKWGDVGVLSVIKCDNGTAYEVFLWKTKRVVCIDNNDIVEG